MSETSIHPTRPGQRRLPFPMLAALSLAMAMALAGCNRQAPASAAGAQATEVGVLAIAPQRIPQITELSGRLSALRVSDVRPQVGGIILKRLFTEGSDVTAGQVLYQIDPASYQASYDQARGTLEKAKATLASAKTKANRYVELVKINAVSKQDYDDAMSAVQEDQADVVADQAALESARVDLQRTRITAPISGRIGASSVTEGALVTADQTDALATIQTFDTMYLDAPRSSAEWLKLRKEFVSGRLKKAGNDSAAVQLILEDGSTYSQPGALQFSGITVNATTGSVTLRSLFPNPERELLPGMFVRARLDEGEIDGAILVPQTAVSRNSDGVASVYVVDASDHARQVTIQADEAYADKWIVASGLKQGDRVIVSGLQKVRSGVPVRIVPDAAGTVQASAAATQR